MKKHIIYQLGIIYQVRIATQELKLADVRYFRDAFKVYVELAEQIERDRVLIEQKSENKVEEFEILFSEEVDVPKLSDEVLKKIEELGIKVISADLSILEEAIK